MPDNMHLRSIMYGYNANTSYYSEETEIKSLRHYLSRKLSKMNEDNEERGSISRKCILR